MKRYLFLLLPLLVVAPSPAELPRVRLEAAIIRGHDFAALTRAEALQLAGKRAWFRVVLDSSEVGSETEANSKVAYYCITHDSVHRTLMFVEGEKLGRKMVVEATLMITGIPTYFDIVDGSRQEGYTEYLLRGVKRIK
jgi:hypothetical protein